MGIADESVSMKTGVKCRLGQVSFESHLHLAAFGDCSETCFSESLVFLKAYRFYVRMYVYFVHDTRVADFSFGK